MARGEERLRGRGTVLGSYPVAVGESPGKARGMIRVKRDLLKLEKNS